MIRRGLNFHFRNVTYDTRAKVRACGVFSGAGKYLIPNNHRIHELEVGAKDIFIRAGKCLIPNNHGIRELEVDTNDIFIRAGKYLLCV